MLQRSHHVFSRRATTLRPRATTSRTHVHAASHFPHLHDIRFEMDEEIEGLGVLSLNRPERRDALTEGMGESIITLAKHLDTLPPGELRCVMITGSSPKSFSAGRDLKLSATHTTPAQRTRYMRAALESVLSVRALKVPTVACVRGCAFGWGLELALACDLRIAAADAVLCLPETSLGIFPGAGGAVLLPRLVGPAVAKDLILTARRFDGVEAATLGVVNAADADPPAAARAAAARICANGPLGCRAAKEMIDGGADLAEKGALKLSSGRRVALDATEDYLEALRAFREGGPRAARPKFHGR